MNSDQIPKQRPYGKSCQNSYMVTIIWSNPQQSTLLKTLSSLAHQNQSTILLHLSVNCWAPFDICASNAWSYPPGGHQLCHRPPISPPQRSLSQTCLAKLRLLGKLSVTALKLLVTVLSNHLFYLKSLRTGNDQQNNQEKNTDFFFNQVK